MKRRNFIKASSIITLPVFFNGFGISAIARSAFSNGFDGDNDKILVLVQLRGGNDTLNTVIPLDQYGNLSKVRSNIMIPANNVIKLNDQVGLHPSMTKMKSIWDDGKLNIIRGAGYPNQNRSHFRSTDIWNTGSAADEQLTTGWMGRYFAQDHGDYPTNYPNAEHEAPFAITIGSAASETCQGLVSNYSIAVNDASNAGELFEGEWDTTPNNCYGEELNFVRETIRQSNAYANVVSDAFEKGSNKTTEYADDNRLAGQFKTVARLISGGLKTKLYVVNLGGFDTHSGQVEGGDPKTGVHATLLKTLSDAIYAFQDDLRLLGVEERVMGLTYSEFGRRIKSNDSYGTDHGSAVDLFVFGSCVNPQLTGDNPEVGEDVGRTEAMPMQYDFRSVYGSLLLDWFGASEDSIRNILYEDFERIPIVKGCSTTATEPDLEPNAFSMEIEPNPVFSTALLRFESLDEHVRISIFNELGAEVEVLSNRKFIEGKHEIDFDTSRFKPGVYYIRMMNSQRQKTKRFVKM